MSVYEENRKAVEAAQKKARETKEKYGVEAANSEFIFDMINQFNETLAGEITLADGQKVDTPKIQHRFEI